MHGETRLSIGELARRIGTTPRSLRHYEQQGLLSPSREENGYRTYDAVAVARARNIKDLLEAGLTTKDVLHYSDHGCLDRPLADAPRCASEIVTAERRMDEVDEVIARLQGVRDRLSEHHATIERGLGTDRPA